MTTLLVSLGLFAAAFAVHYGLWRVRVPRHSYATLLFIFVGVPLAGLTAVYLAGGPHALGGTGAWELLRAALLTLAMAFVYIINYSAIEWDSPTMTFVGFVLRAGSAGRERREFDRLVTVEVAVLARLRALVAAGLAEESDGRYRLTVKGRLWRTLFGLWMRLFRGSHTG